MRRRGGATGEGVVEAADNRNGSGDSDAKLSQQVGQIGQRLDRIDPLAAPSRGEDGGAYRLEAAKRAFSGQDGDGTDRLVRATRPPLPDPRLVRRIIRQRQLRARFFEADLFADPAWDMLLDLTAARA